MMAVGGKMVADAGIALEMVSVRAVMNARMTLFLTVCCDVVVTSFCDLERDNPLFGCLQL